MIQQNLFRHDDILIRIGWLMAVIAAVAIVGAAQRGGLAFFGGLVLFGSAPFGLLFAGYRVRAREKRYVAIWRILDRAMEVRVPDLLASTGYSREDVTGLLAIVNQRGLGYYVWDTARDVIVDGRLQTAVVVAERCPSCGAAGAQHLSLGVSGAPCCAHCGATFPVEMWNRLKLQAMRDLREAPPPQPAAPPAFNPVVLIVLAIVFWPLALLYYFRYGRAR